MQINYPNISKITSSNPEHKKILHDIMRDLKPTLKKYGVNPPLVNELTGKNSRWSCSTRGIGVKVAKQNRNEPKGIPSLVRDIVDASVQRKYLLKNDKKNPERYEIKKEILEELKKNKIYTPAKPPKNQFKGFKYEATSKFGTSVKSIHRDAAKVLLKLDYDLQPILKAFDIDVTNLHETQSTQKEGHNRNHGKIISVKVLNRTYDQIFYTALHELAHSKEFNHGKGFKQVLGQLIIWCANNSYPDYQISRSILNMGLHDTKYKPVIK